MKLRNIVLTAAMVAKIAFAEPVQAGEDFVAEDLAMANALKRFLSENFADPRHIRRVNKDDFSTVNEVRHTTVSANGDVEEDTFEFTLLDSDSLIRAIRDQEPHEERLSVELRSILVRYLEIDSFKSQMGLDPEIFERAISELEKFLINSCSRLGPGWFHARYNHVFVDLIGPDGELRSLHEIIFILFHEIGHWFGFNDGVAELYAKRATGAGIEEANVMCDGGNIMRDDCDWIRVPIFYGALERHPDVGPEKFWRTVIGENAWRDTPLLWNGTNLSRVLTYHQLVQMQTLGYSETFAFPGQQHLFRLYRQVFERIAEHLVAGGDPSDPEIVDDVEQFRSFVELALEHFAAARERMGLDEFIPDPDTEFWTSSYQHHLRAARQDDVWARFRNSNGERMDAREILNILLVESIIERFEAKDRLEDLQPTSPPMSR